MNIFTAELASKRLGLLDELLPKTSVITLLVNPNFPPSAANAREVQTAAHEVGRQVILLNASNTSEIDATFATMGQRARPP